jgi:hypothetical protein
MLPDRQTIDRERKHSEVIMMRSMAARRAGTAVTGPLEVVDGLLETLAFGVPGPTRGERRLPGGDVVGRPMMPGAGGRIGILAKEDKAARPRRRAAPVERRGEVFAIAGEAARDRRPSEKVVELSRMGCLPYRLPRNRLPRRRAEWIDVGQTRDARTRRLAANWPKEQAHDGLEHYARRPNRERRNPVIEQTRIVNQIKAILTRFGIRSFRPTPTQGRGRPVR